MPKTTFDKLGLTALIAIGGDGSLSTALQLHEEGIPIIGVPKTIDNDLEATAMTFGFDSAVACVADALDRLHTTATSHKRVMVLEVMGRHAGWIALYGGFAGGADVILIPEIPFDYDKVAEEVMRRDKAGAKSTMIVVAEGASPTRRQTTSPCHRQRRTPPRRHRRNRRRRNRRANRQRSSNMRSRSSATRGRAHRAG